jgi:cephalosporin hydroxylase
MTKCARRCRGLAMGNLNSSTNADFTRKLGASDMLADLWTTGQLFMGHDMSQYPIELYMWEKFLHARTDIKSIIELGSMAFGLSLFLAMQAKNRGMAFKTFDCVSHVNLCTPLSTLLELNKNFILGDIFGNTKPILVSLLKKLPHPLLLYCDDGDKPREFAEFVPHLHSGDYVGVHDWDIEICESDTTDFNDVLQPLYWDKWEALGSITRFWRRL